MWRRQTWRGDIHGFERADVRFHLEIVRASGNEALSLVMHAVRDAIAARLFESLTQLDDPLPALRQLIDEHEAILQAIVDGDPGLARRLSGEHLTRHYGDSAR